MFYIENSQEWGKFQGKLVQVGHISHKSGPGGANYVLNLPQICKKSRVVCPTFWLGPSPSTTSGSASVVYPDLSFFCQLNVHTQYMLISSKKKSLHLTNMANSYSCQSYWKIGPNNLMLTNEMSLTFFPMVHKAFCQGIFFSKIGQKPSQSVGRNREENNWNSLVPFPVWGFHNSIS